ncbi:unannotated protein [freshwater metagenome]|uniref:Unannotated protein n=1 Tax=freshwater metagenome TaxID=449393 RepID=A0A6J6EIK5_9ZZZZ
MPPKKVVSVNAPLAILLPPSEGKAAGGGKPGWRPGTGEFGRALTRQRAELLTVLESLGGGDAKLLGVGGRNLEEARRANLSLPGSPTMPAHQRYTGVVWDHLAPSTMTATVHARATESIIVLSGLLGLVAFEDPIPDYKLKIGASLPSIGKLATWWREPLSKALNARLAGRHVIDLLPNEHRAAWTPTPDAYAGLSTVAFVEKSGKVAGHDAKAAKGLLARHLLESTDAPADALRKWRHPRFKLEIREVSPGRS